MPPYTFSLLDDADGRFSIDGSTLKVAGALSGPSTHSIEVQAVDQAGIEPPITQVLEITVPFGRADYALYLAFTEPDFWRLGVQNGAVTAVAGYAFARTGVQGAIDSDGSVDWFAANVPAINGHGFHAYGALTNVIRNNNLAVGWTGNVVRTPAAALAPDGTMTMARIADANDGGGGVKNAISANETVTAGVNTFSVVVKREAGNNWIALQTNSFDDTLLTFFDLANGVVGTVGHTAAFIVPLGNDRYRCVVIWNTATDLLGTFRLYLAAVDGNASYNANGSSLLVWQVQNLAGSFSNGGPLISTTSAAAGIGASVLSLSLPNGNYSATYTFDDNTTQTIATAVASGAFVHPVQGTLNRGRVKRTMVSAS